MLHSTRTMLLGTAAALLFATGARSQQLLPPQGSVPRQQPRPGAIQQTGLALPAAGQQNAVQSGAVPPNLNPQNPGQSGLGRPIAPGQGAQLAPAAPDGFQLNALQQANLDLILNAWQAESAKVSTFRCEFRRWEYDPAFGPAPDIALFDNNGELSFERPDKGSFKITTVRKWQFKPVPPNQPPNAPRTGDWIPDPKAVGEHWVCDGKNIFEYRHEQKQLVVRPIPPQMQGQSIVDGPLPFLFGAEVNKLKARYWMTIKDGNGQLGANQIMIAAIPKQPADAANYKMVEIILEKPQMLPSAMQIHLPNNGRYAYTFNLANAQINSRLAQIKAWFKPPEILPGWQRIVEPMPMPLDQASQPVQPPR